jgi:hypothetical protein
VGFWVKHYAREDNEEDERKALRKSLQQNGSSRAEIDAIMASEYGTPGSDDVFEVLEQNSKAWGAYLNVCSEWERTESGPKLNKLAVGEIINRLQLDIGKDDYHKILLIEQLVIKEL